MWRRDVCSRPPERWGSTPEDWERKAAEERRGMESTIVQWRAAGWSDACIGEAIRDDLEAIEVCSINIELLNRMGSFDDPAWIERRSLASRTRLEATTDPLLLPGYRKLVRPGVNLWSGCSARIEKTSTKPDDIDLSSEALAKEDRLFPPPLFLRGDAVQHVSKLNPEGIGHPVAPPHAINLSHGAISRLRA